MERSETIRERISKTVVEAMPIGGRIVDSDIDGFMARRLPSGAIAYGFRYRIKGKPQRWISLGVHGKGHYTADRARKDARALAVRVENREDPYADDRAQKEAEVKKLREKKNTVNVVLDSFLDEYVDKEKKLRTAKGIERKFELHVRPAIGIISIHKLNRDDINQMMRGIAKNAGPVARDRTIAYLNKCFNWYEVEDETFRNPIVKGMRGNSSKARERTLADQEIRSLWQALQSETVPQAFAKLVRVLLFTGQRRSDVADLHDREVDGDTWTIPANRYKNGSEQYVYLTPRVVEFLPKTKGYRFGARTDGRSPFSGFSKGKAELDAVIKKQRKEAGLAALPHWTLHDLRRTARSLMSRAGVRPDIAEIVVGHKLTGVRAVYDRYTYAAERKDALEKLAGLLDQIIDPHPNIIPIRQVGESRRETSAPAC
jgi:integrase